VILEECHRFLIIVQFTISLAQFRHTLDDRQRNTTRKGLYEEIRCFEC
jgi:hypothetical protein